MLTATNKPVRLTRNLMLPDGGSVRAGVYYVVREYEINRERLSRLALGNANGRIVAPCVDPADVETLNERSE